MKFSAPRGTQDIFGDEAKLWIYVEEIIRDICNVYNFNELRTPIFEHTELFARGVGEETDIVQKEMYSFLDKAGRSLTLRPENTASAVRAYLENKMFDFAQPVKIYYIGPMFRYERPQAGRMRQFHQYGIEVFGSYDPICDADVISLNYLLIKRLGLRNIVLKINTLGCKKCRPVYNKALVNFIFNRKDQFCETCQHRVSVNPLRILDCKNDSCQKILEQAPSIIDYLDEDCKNHFLEVQQYLDNLTIPYQINHKIVRGLDYYNRTVFEFVSEEIGSQGTVCGGGRYDLIQEFGGKEVGGVGFAGGMERLIMLVKQQHLLDQVIKKPEIFIASLGTEATREAQKICFELRKNKIMAEMNLIDRNLKAQLKYANRLNCRYSCVLGDSELKTNKIRIKNMETGNSEEITIDQIQNYLIQQRK